MAKTGAHTGAAALPRPCFREGDSTRKNKHTKKLAVTTSRAFPKLHRTDTHGIGAKKVEIPT